MALSEQQLEMLRNAPWVNKDLLSAYEKGGKGFTEQETAAVAQHRPSDARVQQIANQSFVDSGTQKQITASPTLAGEDQNVDRITNFSVALNEAIHEARKQRQDVSMDFMSGVVPVGALPATSFASVLDAFNRSAAPIEASLMDHALEDRQSEMARLEEVKNNIRDLALSVGQAGAGQDTVNAIMALIESGDLDGAIRIAAPALEKKGVTMSGPDKSSAPGGSTAFQNEEGETVWEMTPNAIGIVGGGENGRGFIWSNPIDFLNAKSADVKSSMRQLLGDKFDGLYTALRNDTLRASFMNEYMELSQIQGKLLDPVEYAKIWEKERVPPVTLSWPKETTTSSDEPADRFDEMYPEE